MPIAEPHQIPELATAIVRAKTKVLALGWNPAISIVWPLKPAYWLMPELFADDGAHRDGIPLQGLSALAEEDPDKTVIIVCRSEEHTSELQSLMRSSYAVLSLKTKTQTRQVYIVYNYEITI